MALPTVSFHQTLDIRERHRAISFSVSRRSICNKRIFAKAVYNQR